MKTTILAILTVALLVTAFAYGLDKTLGNRCDYYMSQAHPTAQEIQMCK